MSYIYGAPSKARNANVVYIWTYDLMSYIYGAPSKARNANVVYIWTYV